ncbi:MAG: LAGLIDADG family homing endonuclease [Acidimicrobiia bacterium]
MAIAPEQTGIGIRRHYTTAGAHPYDELEWERRDARIQNHTDGTDAFFQPGVEFPTGWSQNAANIVAQKYFRGTLGTAEREWSLRQVVDRVVDTITAWGERDGYFTSTEETEAFRDELKHILVNQHAAFNSPVWFNIGVEGVPQQASACQPYEAPVVTPMGLVPIGELVEREAVGEKVYDAHGLTRIVAVKHNGRKEVHRVHTKAGVTLDVTADHLVWRSSGERSGRFVPAGDLVAGDTLEWHRSESWGDGEILTKEIAEAALAGWLQSDGFVGQYAGTNRSLTIEAMTVTSEEHEWVNRAIDVVLGGVHRHEVSVATDDPTLDCRRIRLYGEVLRPFVEKWDLLARGTDMCIPDRLLTAPQPVVAAYLRSLFQAEGYVSVRAATCKVGLDMISEDVVRGAQRLLSRFGIFSRVRRKRDRRENRHDLWSLSVQVAGDRRRFADSIGFVDERKRGKLDCGLEIPGRAALPVKRLEIERVESIGETDVYDIQTESGEYLSGNIRVHNCFILAVDDTMDGILNWYREEGIIFKGGSGAGINLSNIRSSVEGLKGGGTASGPVSFMRGADASAGTIKCLHEDTPIATDHGVVPIRDVRPGWQVDTRFGLQDVEAVHDNGIRPLVRVRTELGDEIVCTPEHRFRVRCADGEQWRRAGELEADDRILIDLSGADHGRPQALEPVEPGHHREIDHDLPETIDEAFALWLGWIWGDGSITKNQNAEFVTVQLGDEDAELASRFRALTRTVFGSRVHFYENRHDDRPDASCSLRFSSGQIIRFLERNGLRKPKSKDLSVPASVKSSPASVRAAFLAGLFEADGHVGNGYPQLSTVSEQLAVDVHRLLTSIGVLSTIGRIDDRRTAFGDRPVSVVRAVSGEAVRRFAKLVGFVSERKSAALDAAVERKNASPFETKWVLPHVVGELCRVWERSSDQRLRRAIAPYCRYRQPRSISLLRVRALLERFPEELGNTSLVRFAEGRDCYVAVSVENAGEGPVRDLTVANAHEYSVNGTVVHNSGGKTRRAAKMVILNADHPDIEEFIWCKAREEQKARALGEAGFDMDLDGADSHSIQYQNANNSVRVTDEFMQAVVDDADWELRAVLDGEPVKTVKARELMRQVSEASWQCADPGMQFDTTINRWHTASNTGPINGSNPCSEYMHIDNSACNLASINLLKYLRDDGTFDVEAYEHTVEVVFTAQEILVGNADYPTDKIADNSRAFRQLGLGYANLGALLMAQGLPYDSHEGRTWAAALTSLMTGHAYATSARTAARMGPYAGYAENTEPTLNVLRMHREETAKIDEEAVPPEILSAAQRSWDDAVALGEAHGVRNSQASVLAPTGTIGLMMDCDTTGIEPDLALTKAKKLVGGGTMFIVNKTIPRALERLGYPPEQIDEIVRYIDDNKTIIGAPGFNAEHLPVFACSMGDNPIHYSGHITMMGAVQPFISGAISKCVTGDTLLATADGLVRIGELHDGEAPDSFRDATIEVASLYGTHKTDAFYYGGERPVREVVLRSGQRVTGTPNHRLLVAGEEGLDWKRLDELERGDWVATRYGTELWSELPARFDDFTASAKYGSQKQVRVPDEMSEELAFLLGAYASEGHTIRSTWTIVVTNSVDAVLDRVARAWPNLFGVQAKIDRRAGRCPQVVVSSKEIVEFLEHLGCGARAAAKRIPDAVLRSPRSMVLAFLQGLALDAYVSVSSMPKWAICLDSPALLDDLQAVLANLGVVHGRIGKRNDRYGKTYDEVYATGLQAAHLVELVPFLEPDKAARAERLCEKAHDSRHNTSDVLPGIDSRALYELLPRGRSGRSGKGTGVRAQFAFLCDPRTSRVTRETLGRVAAVPGVALPEWLVRVLDDDLHFSPVESVGDAGSREVFDVSVPVTHAFVGNGIVNHNTVNVPEEVTVEDVEQLHIDAWRLGLKAVAIYRDNCKVAQPLATQKKAGATADGPVAETPAETVERIVETVIVQEPVRQKLPKQRDSKTFSFRVADCHGYVTVGQFEDGRPGEIFLKVAKQGSTLAGIMDAFAISVSHGLQYGVPLEAFVRMYTNMRFEPAGMTDDPDIRFATSLVDYIFRRLAVEYLEYDKREALGVLTIDERKQPTLPGVEEAAIGQSSSLDLPLDDQPPAAEADTPAPPSPPVPRARQAETVICHVCGDIMQPAGSCHACPSCGATSGCS